MAGSLSLNKALIIIAVLTAVVLIVAFVVVGLVFALKPSSASRTTTAPPVCEFTKVVHDVIFLIDSSRTMTSPGFNNVKATIKDFSREFTISNNFTQIALFSFDQNATLWLEPQSESTQDVLNSLNSIPFNGNVGQNIFDAFSQVNSLIADQTSGLREDVPKLLILFSSNSPTGVDPVPLSDELHNKGWIIVAVGYGIKADVFKLDEITGDEMLVKHVANGNHLEEVVLPWLNGLTCQS